MWGQFYAPALYQRTNKHVRFPVKRTVAHLAISPCLAHLTVTQHFHNKNPSPVECSYAFKLLPEVLIRSVKAKINDKTVKFALKQKEQAKEVYSDAISDGYTAVLMTRDEEDLLEFTIGQFPAETDLEITLKIAYPTLYVLDHWECIVSKAFFPAVKVNKRQKPKKPDDPVPFTIEITSLTDIVSVSSPSHSVQSTITGTTASVHLLVSRANTLDFSLAYSTTVQFTSQCTVSLYPPTSEYTAMVAFRSTFAPDARVTGEYVFMLDRSGSMAGGKVEMMKEAMVFLLKSLPVECKFNVVSFGSTFELMFEAPRRYGDESVVEAVHVVKGFKADLGGTNVLQALTAVLSVPAEAEYPRNIIMLTDGCVEHGNEVLSLLKQHQKVTRFHAIGLGTDVSEKWLQQVSFITHGGHEIIHHAKSLSARLVTVLERILTPSMTGLQVTWPYSGAVQAPAANTLRTVYQGDVLYVYANVGKTELTGQVTVSYWDTALKAQQSVSIPVTPVAAGKLLTQFWAKAYLSDLEGASPPSQSALTEVSLKYAVLCSATAYVGQSEDVVTTDVPMVAMVGKRETQALYSLGGLRVGCRGGTRLRKSTGVDVERGLMKRTKCKSRAESEGLTATVGMRQRRSKSRSRSGSSEREQPGSLQWIIEAQSSAGFWPLPVLRPILKSTAPPSPLQSFPEADSIWATLQMLYLLLTKYQEDAEKTTLIVRKARRWLEERGVRYEQYEDSLRLLGY